MIEIRQVAQLLATPTNFPVDRRVDVQWSELGPLGENVTVILA